MGVFDDLPAIIADVLDDTSLGFQSVTLTSVTPGTYDPSTGTVTGGSTTTTTLRAVVEDFKGLELIAGLVQAGDKKVTIAGANVASEPKPTDTVTVGSVVYAVERVNAVAPGSSAVIYELTCRRT